VTSTTTPIGVTMIMNNRTSSSSPDFYLYLYNPSDTQVAMSEGTLHQEIIRFLVSVPLRGVEFVTESEWVTRVGLNVLREPSVHGSARAHEKGHPRRMIGMGCLFGACYSVGTSLMIASTLPSGSEQNASHVSDVPSLPTGCGSEVNDTPRSSSNR
jgi:hypothetical protein